MVREGRKRGHLCSEVDKRVSFGWKVPRLRLPFLMLGVICQFKDGIVKVVA